MVATLLAMWSCSNKSKNDDGASSDLKYATGLVITKGNGYTKVTVKDPWNKGKNLQTYVLVARNGNTPTDLPEGVVVKVPLQSALVYSDVHASIIKELGAISSVKAVCDAQYFKTQEISGGLKSGGVVDCGSSMSPNVEKIVSAAPEAILLSPFQNGGFGALSNLGIPIIQLSDYMEQSPLGRAEWVKFVGLLFGKSAEAESLFGKVADDYNSLLGLVGETSERPKVISETVMSGVWYVPGGKSYKAAFFKDAGADYPWASDESSGSLPLDFAQVLSKAQDADVWLVTTLGRDLTADGLLAMYPHNDEFAAYKNHGVFYANTAESRLFEETPFHPEMLLKEYIKIFHPEVLPDYELRYYKPMKY